MSHLFASALLAIISLGSVTLPCRAVQSDRPLKGAALGASIDRFFYEDAGITTVSFHYSQLRPNKLGTEIGAALFPEAINAGALVLAPDLGAAFNASGSGFTLLAKGGLSTLLGLGQGFGFYPGYHFGSGLIVRTGNRSGVRLDVVRHVYFDSQASAAFWSVGLGLTGLPRKAAEAPPTSVRAE
jgi:hypothetical protein